ncbi:15555_t:CDS:2, partial [Racocetra persica]
MTKVIEQKRINEKNFKEWLKLIFPRISRASIPPTLTLPENFTFEDFDNWSLTPHPVYYKLSDEKVVNKLKEYWTYLSQSSTIPALLDPSIKYYIFSCEQYVWKASEDIKYNENYNLRTRILHYTESNKSAGSQYDLNKNEIYVIALK